MTFNQLESAWNMGKRKKGISVRSKDEAMNVSKNWRRHIGL